MRDLGLIEMMIAASAAVFVFVVAVSNRAHKTRTAAIISIGVSLCLLGWDRYLYVSTSRGLLDTLTCVFTPSARPCQDGDGPDKRSVQLQPEPERADATANQQSSAPPVSQSAARAPAEERTIVLDDRNARSIWTTSVYSYAPGGGGPGGGLADNRLRVGGWGDTYLSLLSIPVPEMHRRVRRATLALRLKPDDPRSSPTPMRLLRITEPWDWRRGDRLWWRDVPSAEFVANLPAPPGGQGAYEIDITDIYNDWALLRRPVLGIMLAPVLTNNNYSTFHSTRAAAPLRPRLTLVY